MTDISKHQHGGLNRGRHVAVIGGGIGGLTAALAFAQTGARVEVFEQAGEIKEVGAGIQITPNGARVLDALGVSGAASIRSEAVIPMDGVNGQPITRFDLTMLGGPPYQFFHRADLIDVLARSCRDAGVDIHLGQRIEGHLPDGDLVIDASGVKSGLRTWLNGEHPPFFTGQVAWRAVIPFDGADPVARIWMAPGRHVVTYPLTGGRLNIVAVEERAAWASEGWSHEDDPANLRAAFAGLAAPLTDILAQVQDVNLWGLWRHPVADRWHGPVGAKHIALLGDAAHPTLPFLAQGANLAIEDAYVLARCCDEQGDISEALRSYEDLRKNRVTRAIEAANANARNYHLSGIRRRVAHIGLKMLGKVAPNAFINRLSWLYDHDVTK